MSPDTDAQNRDIFTKPHDYCYEQYEMEVHFVRAASNNQGLKLTLPNNNLHIKELITIMDDDVMRHMNEEVIHQNTSSASTYMSNFIFFYDRSH